MSLVSVFQSTLEVTRSTVKLIELRLRREIIHKVLEINIRRGRRHLTRVGAHATRVSTCARTSSSPPTVSAASPRIRHRGLTITIKYSYYYTRVLHLLSLLLRFLLVLLHTGRAGDQRPPAGRQDGRGPEASEPEAAGEHRRAWYVVRSQELHNICLRTPAKSNWTDASPRETARRDAKPARHLKAQFHKTEVSKRYLCLVHGRVAAKSGIVTASIRTAACFDLGRCSTEGTVRWRSRRRVLRGL